jgi:hypothetical protein
MRKMAVSKVGGEIQLGSAPRAFSFVTCVSRETIDFYRLPPVVEFRVPRGSDIQAGCRPGSVAQGRQWCSGLS